MNPTPVPVIAIDGPSASGKGTVAKLLAGRLGFHYLDSGAIYRALAAAVVEAGIDLADEAAIADLAADLDLRFEAETDRVWLGDREVTELIRGDDIGAVASKIAGFPSVRAALLARQRAFRLAPGLVADGRDMGSKVFVDADLKVFLTASVKIRAERRYKQLIKKGVRASLDEVAEELALRDERDCHRAESPLCRQADALLIDTSDLSITEAVDRLFDWWCERRQKGGAPELRAEVS